MFSSLMHSPAVRFRELPMGARALLCAAPCLWLWGVLINDLRGQWSLYPQYAYGWAVPALCAYLFWRGWQHEPDGKAGNDRWGRISPLAALMGCIVLALLYAPTRLVEASNTGWRLTSWLMAIEVVGITVGCLRLAWPTAGLPLFPLFYFLVAVPWPTGMERVVIQNLTHIDATATGELLGWFGIPAMPHGNVIEVATGTVDIDEACSGIRSLQATLMIALFLGEFYQLPRARRALLVLGGFALALVFNLARMTVLAWVAASKGMAAISVWHDPTGVTILLGCFFCLWALGGVFNRKRPPANPAKSTAAPGAAARSEAMVPAGWPFWLATGLTIWIAGAECAIEAWYRAHEQVPPHAVQWTVAWPTDNPTFKASPLDGSTRNTLHFDEGASGSWRDNDLEWQAVFLRWDAGRTIYLALNHTPAICMQAVGRTVTLVSKQQWFEIGGTPSASPNADAQSGRSQGQDGPTASDSAPPDRLQLPFAVYEIQDAGRRFYAFYCLWDDRAKVQFATTHSVYFNRLAPVLTGRRSSAMRSIEIVVSGPDTAAAAETAVRGELAGLLRTK